MKSAPLPTEAVASTVWLVRGQQAVCVGLLVATAALLLLAASGVALQQTGPSPGKRWFLLVWGCAGAAVLVAPRRFQAPWVGVGFAGVLLLGAVVVSSVRVGWSPVDSGLVVGGVLLLGAASRARVRS